MSDLFMPKEVKDLDELIRKETPLDSDDVIVIGAGRSIYVVSDDFQRTYHLTSRRDVIFDFTVHKGELYDCDAYGFVHKTFTDDVVFKRGSGFGNLGWIRALESDGEDLYYSDNFKCIKKVGSSDFGITRYSKVDALCFHDGKLYDAGNYGSIYDTLADSSFSYYSGGVTSLCSHKEDLFAATNKDVVSVFNIQKFDMGAWVRCLCSFKDILYAGIDSKIVSVFDNEAVFSTVRPINAMVSVPRKVFGDYFK